VGTDGRLDVPRVADVIVALRADIVCLQELDVGRARTGGIDQAEAIAQLVKMRSRFHPAMYVREEQYGDAILTALPNRVVKAGALPTVNLPGLEPRGALWIDIEAPSPVGGPPLQIINTHLGLVPREQRAQAAALLGPRVVRGGARARAAADRGRHERAAGLVGLPGAAAAAAGRAAARSTARGSFRPFPAPSHAADRPRVRERRASMSAGSGWRPIRRPGAASDHLPLIVDFDLEGAAPAASACPA
jgi:endonuclease/exonuclease/phosphatase family metal-dependent hydrolase